MRTMSKSGVAPVQPKKGEWVVIVGDKIIASDRNAKKIVAIADEYPGAVISKEPTTNACYY